jgi:formylglycine-generating enzyme required for sulfatase activity
MKPDGRRWKKTIAALASLCSVLFIASISSSVGQTDPALIEIPPGPFIMGSSEAERESAYRLDEAAYGHSVTRERGWYEREPQHTVSLEAYAIQQTPVTNAAYARFLQETDHPPPAVSKKIWDGYGLIHPYSRAVPFIWSTSAAPMDRLDHPVVMVSYGDAEAYAAWLSNKTGSTWRLPTEAEWEKAARGPDGGMFPWGNEFDAHKLNSHDAGPFTTVPVGSFPDGASPYGLLDAAGQVFEWTSNEAGTGRHIVKGGSWDDRGCGVCRPAARHSRPDGIKHILVGFRLLRESR